MERIVLEVDDETGKAYNKFNAKTKQEFNRVISLFLKKTINDANSERYQMFLDDMGAIAAKNGLTPQILNQLLSVNE